MAFVWVLYRFLLLLSNTDTRFSFNGDELYRALSIWSSAMKHVFSIRKRTFTITYEYT